MVAVALAGIRRSRYLLGVLLALALASAVSAEYGRIPPTAIDPATLSIDEAEHLGARLDRNISLHDERGTEFRLADLLDKPLILVLSYYRCDGACPTLNRNLAKTIGAARRFRAGDDYRLLTVSFDRNDGAEELTHFVHHLQLPAESRAGWRYAVATRPDGLDALVKGTGFQVFLVAARQGLSASQRADLRHAGRAPGALPLRPVCQPA